MVLWVNIRLWYLVVFWLNITIPRTRHAVKGWARFFYAAFSFLVFSNLVQEDPFFSFIFQELHKFFFFVLQNFLSGLPDRVQDGLFCLPNFSPSSSRRCTSFSFRSCTKISFLSFRSCTSFSFWSSKIFLFGLPRFSFLDFQELHKFFFLVFLIGSRRVLFVLQNFLFHLPRWSFWLHKFFFSVFPIGSRRVLFVLQNFLFSLSDLAKMTFFVLQDFPFFAFQILLSGLPDRVQEGPFCSSRRCTRFSFLILIDRNILLYFSFFFHNSIFFFQLFTIL